MKDSLVKANYKYNDAEWAGIVGVSAEAYDSYMSAFIKDFYTAVIRLIDRAVQKLDTTPRGLIATEIHKHMGICVKEAENFMGREDELFKVRMLTQYVRAVHRI